MSGKLVVIEAGTDASGKETQTGRLFQQLEARGARVRRVEFPDYDSRSSALIRMYLDGEFGTDPSRVNPYAASTFYAVDRFASFQMKWGDFYRSGGLVLADRYTTSNMVYQGAKFNGAKEWGEYLDWLCELEFEKLGLPVPDLVIFLDMPPAASRRLMLERKSESDIHEASQSFLERTYRNALRVAERYGWVRVECAPGGALRSVDDIHREIYTALVERGLIDAPGV